MHHVHPKTVFVVNHSFCANLFAFEPHVKFKWYHQNYQLPVKKKCIGPNDKNVGYLLFNSAENTLLISLTRYINNILFSFYYF